MSWIDLREFTYDVVTMTTHGGCPFPQEICQRSTMRQREGRRAACKLVSRSVCVRSRCALWIRETRRIAILPFPKWMTTSTPGLDRGCFIWTHICEFALKTHFVRVLDAVTYSSRVTECLPGETLRHQSPPASTSFLGLAPPPRYLQAHALQLGLYRPLHCTPHEDQP